MTCFYLQEEFSKILIAYIDDGEREESDDSEDDDESEEDPLILTLPFFSKMQPYVR
jgi:hypothetical protein